MTPPDTLQHQHDSAYSWLRLAISLIVAIVGSMGMWTAIVVLPEIQGEFATTRSNATLPYLLTMLGFGAGTLLLGRAVDRWGIAPVIAGSGVSMSIGFYAAALTPSFTAVSVLHVLIGVGSAASFGPLIADVSLWFAKRRGIAVAVTASGNYLAGAIWPPITTVLTTGGSWRDAYEVFAIVAAVVVIPGALLLRRRIDEASTHRATEMAAARNRDIGMSPGRLQFILSIAGIGCCTAMAMPQVHIVALCIDRGFGAAAGAEMLSVMLIGGVISRLGFGMLADRLGGLKTLFIGAFMQCLTLCLFLIQGDMTSLYLISFVFGLSQGGIVPSYAIIIREFLPPREAGRRIGLVIAATIVGMSLGGWMSGYLYDISGDYALAIWNGVGWNLLTIAIALTLLIKIGPSSKATATALN